MRFHKFLAILLILGSFSFFLAAFAFNRKLHLIACNVGQGDAILATYGNFQILTDGGPDNKVLDCLGKYIPFWDREIEVVVLTHPDKDHFAGLIEVFRRYKVDYFLTLEASISNQNYEVLKNAVGGTGARVIYPSNVSGIRAGKIYLDILALKGNNYLLENVKEESLNDMSIVSQLSFGKFDALLSGDMGIKEINTLLEEGKIKDVEYIKISHHGSDNNITYGLLQASKPEIAVISVGKNSYGHPNKKVLELLKENGINYFRTDEIGDIKISSNGKTWRIIK